MQPSLHIYRSSAGSGKTRTIAKEYLKLALGVRSDYFKHILAVTFTNKSTQEMKDRIMHYLDVFSRGEQNDLSAELSKELKLDPQTFQNRAREVQAAILHGYHQFSISTIDAFFQKVIRSFTREAGILGDYRLEVETDEVMEEVVTNLIADLGPRKQLTDWVVELALQNLENDRSWDMRQSLTAFSKEILREEFKEVEESIIEKTESEKFFPNTLETLRAKKYEFVKFVHKRAKEIVVHFRQMNLTVDDFKNKSRGSIYTILVKMVDINSVKGYVDLKWEKLDSEFQFAKNWIPQTHVRFNEVSKIIEQKWIPTLIQILEFKAKNFKTALTAEVALNNFYSFGLLTDISKKLAEYKHENNLMLLADAPQFLNGIIRDSDTPFIYEKAGSFYKNFLIDEFQDTSGLQWKNFMPLLINSLDSKNHNLIVGDAKQAIYRWRGGDQRILQQASRITDKSNVDERSLTHNYRSTKEIVMFNNALFKESAKIIASESGIDMLEEYKEATQEQKKNTVGFVQVQFFPDVDENKWNEYALDAAVKQVEALQQKGVKPQEIAFLVRKNDEGEKIISRFIEHKNTTNAKPGCIYDVVSSESLRVDSAASVNLLVSVLSYLLNPTDDIARAQLAYEYARQNVGATNLHVVFSESSIATIENNLPADFSTRKIFFKKLPLFELTETVINIFNLKSNKGEIPYLLSFQDLVIDFVNRERNDLGAFLAWWNEYKHKKYIVAPASAEAMQVFTLHKAKGLQFNYVIIPFCSWTLDHDTFKAPQLWVSSEETIFKNIGYLPVRYSPTLKETFFNEEYEAEHSRTYLDNLNLLYVGLTRAEAGLTVYAPYVNVRNFKNTIARILLESIEKSPELSTRWNNTSKTWFSGEVQGDQNTKLELETLTLETYYTDSWRKKLIVKHSSHRPEVIETETQKKINLGIRLHKALARIHTQKDINMVTDQMLSEGDLKVEEKKDFVDQLSKLLSNSVVADWFTDQWKIKTEVHALLPGGEEFRIDRLLLRGNQAVIIDFKTGSQRKDDHQQVSEYCKTLSQMGYNTEGYLLYLTDAEVVNVIPPKASKKKNKDQLGLDF